jgi:hypothetical protein
MKSTCVKGFHNLFSIDQSYETRVKLFLQSASVKQVAESFMNDDIETLKEMYTVGLTLRNLHNCTSAWYKNHHMHQILLE